MCITSTPRSSIRRPVTWTPWNGPPENVPRGPPLHSRVSRVEEYRAALRASSEADWAAYLTERSGLPVSRGNIERGLAFAEEASSDQIDVVIVTGDEYLTFCGVVGLGRLLAEGTGTGARLRAHATDERWRVRLPSPGLRRNAAARTSGLCGRASATAGASPWPRTRPGGFPASKRSTRRPTATSPGSSR